jgi:hypothetical protein
VQGQPRVRLNARFAKFRLYLKVGIEILIVGAVGYFTVEDRSVLQREHVILMMKVS